MASAERLETDYCDRQSVVCFPLGDEADGSIYRRYAIASPADLKAGVEKLASLHVEQSEPANVVVVGA